MTFIRTCLLLLSIPGVLAAGGCSRGDSEAAPTPEEVRQTASPVVEEDVAPNGTQMRGERSFPHTITDGLGREVTLDAPPGRVVSLAPKNTELMFAIGAGEKLVGVTTYCNEPPDAMAIEKVGGFSSQSISIEKLISLRPDLVLSVGELHRPTIKDLERLDVPVVALAAESLDNLYTETELLGRITGREAKTSRLIEAMQRRVARIQERAVDIPDDERVSVFYQVWNDPLAAAGPASFIGELIRLAGGKNIINNASESYVRIGEEILLKRDPDVIIAPSMGAAQISRQDLLEKPSWSGISAVRNGRVYVLDPERFGFLKTPVESDESSPGQNGYENAEGSTSP